jgi:HAD superfamily hydrolase (TIGR01459 family)
MPLEIATLEPLAEQFELFLLDQFGVLHNGFALYPETVNALARLRTLGRRSVIISNSGKRAAQNVQRMTRMGIGPDHYDAMVTSGEIAWLELAERMGSAASSEPLRCFLISTHGDTSPVAGLGLNLVDQSADAQRVLIAGAEVERYSLEDYCDQLADAAHAGVPCICTNPDRIALTPSGTTFGPGRIAERYEAMGGTVTWVGKPFPAIYEHARNLFPQIPAERIVCIGDSIQHDIAGAQAAGFASALVRTGIFADADAASLETLYDTYGATPDFVLPGLQF